MTDQPQRHRRWVLASHPHGGPTAENLRLEESEVLTPGPGQVLLHTVCLSLDPYIHGHVSDTPSYSPSVVTSVVMVGGTVNHVISSNHADYRPGDWVLGYGGWQDYELFDDNGLVKLGDGPQHPPWSLGVLGMPGLTAYMGLLDIDQSKAGETLVVATATGPVGAMVGQISKIKGCHTVGIVGGAEECQYMIETLGFGVCLDHRTGDFAEQLAQACPQGIDVYYENVGGKVFDAVLSLLSITARVSVCRLVSSYNATGLPNGPDRLPLLMAIILKKRIRMQGFIISQDYGHRVAKFQQQMGRWVQEGKIKYREQPIDGLEQTPQALIGLLKGENFGKVVIRVATDDQSGGSDLLCPFSHEGKGA